MKPSHIVRPWEDCTEKGTTITANGISPAEEKERILDSTSFDKNKRMNRNTNNHNNSLLKKTGTSIYEKDTSSRRKQTSSKQNKRYLSPVALDMMESWYEQHFQHPYPSDDVVCYIVRHGKVTPAQVKKWMANKRVRSCNTLSFNGTIHPKRLNRLRKELAASRSQRSTTDDSHSARSLISRPQPIRMTPYPSPYTMPLHTSYMMNYNYLHTQAGGAQPYLWPHVISNGVPTRVISVT
ncbi:hypothetical protein LSH36_8g03032 [Paralvinella palmiformis]|uniref:Homeobox domain-containing protein n=1 Tax=Paralvinella palmiformis TaxID=53620 RepID=A0AAD9KF44_9ANNE|nr:hypothetical protein LSH36_8g03032 [Paralvinella palmiformis]